MTVKQLIESLNTIQDKSVRVMTRGYEGGYNDIDNINSAPIYIALDVNDDWWMGNHEAVDDMHEATSSKYHIVKAIIL